MWFLTKKRSSQIALLTITAFAFFGAPNALSFDALRPLSLRIQAQRTEATNVLGHKKSSAGTLIYEGISNAVPATIIGKAALFTSYSAYDILRNIQHSDIKAERDDVLPNVTEEISKAIKAAGLINAEEALRAFSSYCKKVNKYFSERLTSAPNNRRLIRNTIGALEFFLSVDIRKARAGKDAEREETLKQILRLVQEKAFNDINRKETITPEDAQEQWDTFTQARDELLEDYSSQIDALGRQDRELGEKIEALTMRNEKLTRDLFVAEREHDTIESEAIKDIIKENKSLMSQCADAQTDLKNEHSAYEIDKMVLENISDKDINGSDNILKQNKTVMQLLYKAYRLQEKAALDFDRSIEGSENTYRVFVYGMRRVESVMVRLKNVPAFYLKATYENKDLVLLSNDELPVEALKDLVEAQQKPIKAIVCLEGAIASHWVIVAQGMGIPVVLLGAGTRSAEEIASLEDDIIVETTLGERKGAVVVGPDEETFSRYGASSLRQEFYSDLCLQQYMLGKQGDSDIKLNVYANTSSPKNVKKTSDLGIGGIGLYRTELAPSDKAQSVLKSYLSNPNGQAERLLLDAFIVDMYRSLSKYRNNSGPFVLRTDDFEEDKNVAGIVKLLGKSGFDIYRTDAGRRVIAARIASYYVALISLARKSGYAFIPGMIFPMVKTQRDVRFMRDEIIPIAKSIVLEYLDIDPDKTSVQIDTGPMVETVEACDNIDSIMVDPHTKIISVGNSDLTESVLSRDFGIDIKRGDKYFAQFFSSLKPSVCERYEAVVEAASIWNEKHPDNIKRVGFCGAQATLDEFVLFASFLTKKYDNVPIYISVPPGIVPSIVFFLAHVESNDLEIFNKGIGFKTQQLANDKVRAVYSRIRTTEKYKQFVDARLKSIQRLGIGRIKNNNNRPAQRRKYRPSIESAISSAA